MERLILFGPQRLRPSVGAAMDALEVEGPVAVVTAGWQEREAEDGELARHLGRPLVNLALHARSEEIFAADPELLATLQRRQDRLRELRDLYRLRLEHALAAARALMRRPGGVELLDPERSDALGAVRALDAHYRARVVEVEALLELQQQGAAHPELERHRREVRELVGGCGAIAIAGGHIVVLRNRLLLFGLRELLGTWVLSGRPLLAWSAGAMVLAEEIVLFHDSPPQGPGNAEVLAPGLGLAPGVLPLPHASRRLRLGDPVRVALLARRFAPLLPLALDDGASLGFDGALPVSASGVRTLGLDGRVGELGLQEA